MTRGITRWKARSRMSDVNKVTRKVRELHRSSRRLRDDLRVARRGLMRALVRRDGDGETIRGGYSRRAPPSAVPPIRHVEAATEKKTRHYADLLENPHALQESASRVVHIGEFGRATGLRAKLGLHLQMLKRGLAAILFKNKLAERWDIMPRRGEQLMERALEVGRAFESLSATASGDMERVR